MSLDDGSAHAMTLRVDTMGLEDMATAVTKDLFNLEVLHSLDCTCRISATAWTNVLKSCSVLKSITTTTNNWESVVDGLALGWQGTSGRTFLPGLRTIWIGKGDDADDEPPKHLCTTLTGAFKYRKKGLTPMTVMTKTENNLNKWQKVLDIAGLGFQLPPFREI